MPVIVPEAMINENPSKEVFTALKPAKLIVAVPSPLFEPLDQPTPLILVGLVERNGLKISILIALASELLLADNVFEVAAVSGEYELVLPKSVDLVTP